MAINKCKICSNQFYVKPSHISMGWGVFCSRECKHFGTRMRRAVNCFICDRLIYKTRSQLSRSISGKYFCSKSCQAKWRNVEYSGSKHLGWKGGQSTYRKIMIKNNRDSKCLLCNTNDTRILAVHHLDKNHSNLNPNNLIWLCHNCHFLVHRDKLESRRLLSILRPKR